MDNVSKTQTRVRDVGSSSIQCPKLTSTNYMVWAMKVKVMDDGQGPILINGKGSSEDNKQDNKKKIVSRNFVFNEDQRWEWKEIDQEGSNELGEFEYMFKNEEDNVSSGNVSRKNNIDLINVNEERDEDVHEEGEDDASHQKLRRLTRISTKPKYLEGYVQWAVIDVGIRPVITNVQNYNEEEEHQDDGDVEAYNVMTTLEDFFTLAEIKDGLAVTSRVEELVSVMQSNKDLILKNAGDASRQWAAVASTIVATKNRECLDVFVNLDGHRYLSNWLAAAQMLTNDSIDRSLEEAIFALLGALGNLGVDSSKLVSSGILVAVKKLVDHGSSQIQDQARKLLGDWKDIFQLIVSSFAWLNDVDGPSLGRVAVILETVAKYRSCVVMLDLERDDLVKEVFNTFLDVARDDHPEVVFSSMQNIMVVLLEESEDVQEHLLLILLSKLGRNRRDVSDAARRLAMKVIEQCAPKVESDIKQFLISSVSGDGLFSSSQLDYHEAIYDLYCCAPQALSGVAPYLTGELLADNLETRLKVVGLVGELFSLPGRVIPEEFSSIFVEFLKRLTDRAVEVRMVILDHIKNCLLSDPLRAEAPQIISALCDRLLDYDENIRKQVVAVICDVAVSALTSLPVDTIKLVAERLRDKAILVKTYTMERLTELFRVYCLRCAEDKVGTGDFDWIPGKILRCLYDKDFRSDTIEYIL